MKKVPDSEILAFIHKHAGQMSVAAMCHTLHVGRERLQEVAAAAEFKIPHYTRPKRGPKGVRNWATCRCEKEQRRALVQCARDKWAEFMLFGPVRRTTHWQIPSTNAIRDRIQRPKP